MGRPQAGFLGMTMDRSLALVTDLYELTMAAAYFTNRVMATATFELFVRELPEGRRYLIAACLEQVLQHLERLRFGEEEISILRQHAVLRDVPAAFFDYLRKLSFTGDVRAIAGIVPANTERALREMVAAGAHLVTADGMVSRGHSD